MNTKPTLLFSLLFAFCQVHAIEVRPFAETNDVSLVFEESVSDAEIRALRQDLLRCLGPSRPHLTTAAMEDGEEGEILLLGFWTPEPPLSGLAFPNVGQFTNGTFRIPVDASFLGQYREAQNLLSSWTNEIVQADLFVQSLSTTNLACMSDDEVLSLRLTKSCQPGGHDVPVSAAHRERLYFDSLTLYPPPRISFCLRPEGPSGGGPYLWCQIPVGRGQDLFTFSMVFYRNRWWFSNWHSEPGIQQWSQEVGQ